MDDTGKRLSAQQRVLCQRLAAQGKSYSEIARFLDCTPQTVAYWANKEEAMNGGRTGEQAMAGDEDARTRVLRTLEALMNDLPDVLTLLRTTPGAGPSRSVASPVTVAQNGRPDDRKRGVVKAVYRDRDFAFIKPYGADGQLDVFMHSSKLQDGFSWDDLQTGMTVLYDLIITQNGQHRATAVWPLREDVPLVTHRASMRRG